MADRDDQLIALAVIEGLRGFQQGRQQRQARELEAERFAVEAGIRQDRNAIDATKLGLEVDKFELDRSQFQAETFNKGLQFFVENILQNDAMPVEQKQELLDFMKQDPNFTRLAKQTFGFELPLAATGKTAEQLDFERRTGGADADLLLVRDSDRNDSVISKVELLSIPPEQRPQVLGEAKNAGRSSDFVFMQDGTPIRIQDAERAGIKTLKEAPLGLPPGNFALQDEPTRRHLEALVSEQERFVREIENLTSLLKPSDVGMIGSLKGGLSIIAKHFLADEVGANRRVFMNQLDNIQRSFNSVLKENETTAGRDVFARDKAQFDKLFDDIKLSFDEGKIFDLAAPLRLKVLSEITAQLSGVSRFVEDKARSAAGRMDRKPLFDMNPDEIVQSVLNEEITGETAMLAVGYRNTREALIRDGVQRNDPTLFEGVEDDMDMARTVLRQMIMEGEEGHRFEADLQIIADKIRVGLIHPNDGAKLMEQLGHNQSPTFSTSEVDEVQEVGDGR